MNLRKLVVGAVIAQGLALLGSLAANAEVIYSYTGNHFTNVSGPYTTSDMVTVSIELADPIVSPNLQRISPISFRFADGVREITDTDTTSADFFVSTDSMANVSLWLMDADFSGGTIATANLGSPNLGIRDVGQSFILDTGNIGVGVVTNDPGVWQLTPVPVPEPSTLAGLGLLGVVFLWRLRSR